ncbi:MAG TPA: DUF3040 domain-containing protein [Streptosporangiaceae bacterium]
MPLSEHEQRQLEQIEQALYADYPKLAQAVRAKDPRIHYKRRVVYAAIGFLIGVGLLLAGVVAKDTFIGVGGFVVMLACAMWALTSWRHMGGGPAATHAAAPGRGQVRGPAPGPGRERSQRRAKAPPKSKKSRAAKSSFMERLEERWRRRQEGGR